MRYINKFINDRYSLLGKRAETFRRVFEYLDDTGNDRLNLVETGCVRELGNWIGDGQSTLLFDEFTQHHLGATLTSFEADARAVDLARSVCTGNSTIVLGDSVSNLRHHTCECRQVIDLLYLDSYDVDFHHPHTSALHHLFELLSAQPALSAGALVVVDDAPNGKGKAFYITEYMTRIGAKVLFQDYQIGFVLP